MRTSKQTLLLATATLICATAAHAAHVDMNDPRRALALEDNVRIDAQLTEDAISTGTPVGVTFQVQNNSPRPVAIADKIVDSSYDADTRTITLSIGSEIPAGGTMPHLAVIKMGESRTFSTAVPVRVAMPGGRSPLIAFPRYVQVKVNVLRNLEPFAALIAQQRGTFAPPMTDALFDTWVQSNDAIFLNAIPVYWTGRRGIADQNSADNSSPMPVAAGGTF